MKENENKKTVVQVSEGIPSTPADVLQNSFQHKTDRLKKTLIFGLMGIVFIGCMYLIFKPSAKQLEVENIGLNDAIPQPTDAGMQEDKQKAYEQDILEQKDMEKQSALATLADYWNIENSDELTDESLVEEEENYGFAGYNNARRNSIPSLSSYRYAQSSLGSFYQDDNQETLALRRQLEELKEQLAEKDVPKPATVDDQLQLMEKSYQMAAKYLPTAANTGNPTATPTEHPNTKTSSQKEHFVSFTSVRKNVISSLYRTANDSAFLENWSESRNLGFYTAGTEQQIVQSKNSIKACVNDEQTVIGETAVRLRLLEAAQTPTRTIPKGAILTANAKYQGGRLQLKISSVELEGNILPVDITVYDLDGQQGLHVPYSPEMKALTEMAGNMSQTGGTSLVLSSNAGQQIAADLSRGVVQGVSGYFAKKVRTPKVRLKAGHQVFLVAKQ